MTRFKPSLLSRFKYLSAPKYTGYNMPRELKDSILERDDYKCRYCGVGVRCDVDALAPNKATIDHIVPLSAGGSNKESNLVTACWQCNESKGKTLLLATQKGVLKK